MTKIFISYADEDRQLAQFVHDCLRQEGMDVFMAAIALKPGMKWDQKIIDALNASAVVFFLASEAANSSPYVQQELGAALSLQKTVIPVVWKLAPEDLPGLLRNIQALDLRDISPKNYQSKLSEVAARIRVDEVNQSMKLLLASVILVGILFIAAKGGTA